MARMNVMEARKVFGKTVNRVAFGKERIVLERRGEDVAAVIPIEDLRHYEKLLEEYEDRVDVEEARRVEREAREAGEKPVPIEIVKRELGL